MPTYLGALFFGLPIWGLLYYHRKDLRHKMLFMSFLIAAVSPVDTYFIPDYWNPVTVGQLFGLPIDIFTILFGFVLGGISSVLYEEIVKKTFIRSKKRHHPYKVLIALGPLVLVLLQLFTNINFMINVLVSTIVMIGIIIFVRHDLILDTFLMESFLQLFIQYF